MNIFGKDKNKDSVDSLTDEIGRLENLVSDKQQGRKPKMATANPQAHDFSESSDGSANCGTCANKVEIGIQCAICDVWYHYDQNCSGLKASYKAMMKSIHIRYLCSSCQEDERLRKTDKDIQSCHCDKK